MFFSRLQILVSFGVFLSLLSLPPYAYGEDTPVVAVSIPPLKHFVQSLLGADAKILIVIPAGADHENYEPGISQLQALSQADAFLPIAHPKSTFETVWMERLKELRTKSSPLIVLRPSERMELPSEDMHYWTSPSLVREYLVKLAEDLRLAFPQRRTQIDAALLREQQALQQLRDELAVQAKQAAGCSFLVYHAAWSGLARDLGLQELAIEHEGREPSIRAIAKTLEEAKAKHIHTLFVEPQRTASSVRAYLEELSAKTEVLDPLAEDWEKNLHLVLDRIVRACSEQKQISP